MMSEPFWCDRFQKFLQVIPVEEADRIRLDVQLYWTSTDDEGAFLSWREDIPPEEYRRRAAVEEGPFVPSFYDDQINAIEVDPTKPEYEPTELQP